MNLTPDENSRKTPPASLKSESAFVLVPACFVEGLSPEEFKARQQIYQIAYEKARQGLGDEADYGEFSFDI